jgi:hypothetical protein
VHELRAHLPHVTVLFGAAVGVNAPLIIYSRLSLCHRQLQCIAPYGGGKIAKTRNDSKAAVSVTYLRCRYGPKNTTARPAPTDVAAAPETLLSRAIFPPTHMLHYKHILH